LKSIVFSQDASDGVSHTLVIDEIRIDGSERAASGKAPVAPGNVRAKVMSVTLILVGFRSEAAASSVTSFTGQRMRNTSAGRHAGSGS